MMLRILIINQILAWEDCLDAAGLAKYKLELEAMDDLDLLHTYQITYGATL